MANPITAFQPTATASTTEIQTIESPFTLKEVITALFISTITVLTSILWGIPFGLIAGASSSILAWVASTPAEQAPANQAANLVGELHLDPALEILPHYEDLHVQPNEHERYMNNLRHLHDIELVLAREIYRQSLHYVPSESLFHFMRDHFHGMDFSRLTLLAVKPILFENGQEGYEMVIQSGGPQGWVHLCINKNQDIRPQRAGNCRFTRIPQVTPFLERATLESNHFSTFVLPFREREELALVFAGDFPNMDLCQVEPQSCRPLSFDFHHEAHHGMEAHDDHYDLGFELVFSTPNGTVRYYADPTGQNIARQTQALNVNLLPDE